MVIRRGDRIDQVLKHDESLLETLIAISPVFGALRNPVMRATMARLATVEHAARMAGLHPDVLTERLNQAHAGLPAEKSTAESRQRAPETADGNVPLAEPTTPAFLATLPPERVVDLDVRHDLLEGREPFSRIMAARREVQADGALRLRATFEPVPLYGVMAKQGFDHWTERLARDDWRVWFYPAERSDATGTTENLARATPVPVEEGDGVVVLDVRGMDPPEPMVRTLAALEELPPGGTLVQINERVPHFLLPRLAALGFEYRIREQGEALVRVFIRRAKG